MFAKNDPIRLLQKNVDDGPPFDLALRDGAASGEKPLPAVTLRRCACGARARHCMCMVADLPRSGMKDRLFVIKSVLQLGWFGCEFCTTS